MHKDWSTLGVDLLLDVSVASGRRAGLERGLREAIRDGRLASGSTLPSTRVLAAELGLSRGTVTAAYDQLVAEGYLVAARGSGTVVAERVAAHPAPPSPVATPVAFSYDLRPGSPDVSSFPVASWLRASRRALTSARSEEF